VSLSGDGEANGHSDRDQDRGTADYQPQDVNRARPESATNAQLRSPSHDFIADDPVDADQSEAKSHERKRQQQARSEARLCNRAGQQGFEAGDALHGQLGIEQPQLLAQRRGDEIHVRTRAEDERHRAEEEVAGFLTCGYVDHGHHFSGEAVLPHVADNPNHGQPPRFRPIIHQDPASQRIAIRPAGARDALAHDRHERGAFAIARLEEPSPLQRNTKSPEIALAGGRFSDDQLQRIVLAPLDGKISLPSVQTKRKKVDRARLLNDWKRLEPLQQARVKGMLLVNCPIGPFRKRNRHRQQPVSAKAGIDALELPEALEQKACPNHEDEHQRGFDHDQHSAKTALCWRRPARGAELMKLRRLGAGRRQRWNQPERQAGDKAQQEGKSQHGRVQTDFADPRQHVRRHPAQENRHAQVRCAEPNNPAGECQAHVFCEKLPDEP